MKKFAQTAILIAGLVSLSACASSNGVGDYGNRTAGDKTVYAGKVYDTSGDALSACHERVRRLENMNKACYRK